MNKLLSGLILLALTGCATTHNFEAAPQSYRAKNLDNPIDITGKLIVDHKKNLLSDDFKFAVTIYFDREGVIFGNLDRNLGGDFNGRDYKGHKTASTCTGKAVSQDAIEVRCMVFVDNERTVTLTF